MSWTASLLPSLDRGAIYLFLKGRQDHCSRVRPILPFTLWSCPL